MGEDQEKTFEAVIKIASGGPEEILARAELHTSPNRVQWKENGAVYYCMHAKKFIF